MKHSNKATTPLSQGEVSSLRESRSDSWQSTHSLSQGESTTSQTTESSLRVNEMSVATRTLARHCETSQRLGVAIHTKEKDIDCHESANADSRNDDKDSLNGKSANLPQGWTIKTLGEIAHTTSSGTPSRKILDYWNGNIKWLKSGELNDDYINEVEESITQIGLEKSSAKIFPKGTLLIALYGATIGKLGILNVETATNQAVCAITPNKEFEVKYLFHFLFSIRDKMIQDAFGGAQSNISQAYLKQLKIPIPPLETQKQIVAILEKHFTSADKVGAYINSCLTKAKQLKSSLLKSAFEGGLV